ncbi:expressed unknown protein [Seminavis robusta]|uniref:Uncharacterized protein n=1 Tax=Seminavis robusta TaxID=568900 RepID=A0A9N8H458_9STRA|nr:expressed unknown protein [Seminavis robusta]|eukprot:Sro4_g003680.1 n/a (274) ;mRNA; r:221464-222285
MSQVPLNPTRNGNTEYASYQAIPSATLDDGTNEDLPIAVVAAALGQENKPVQATAIPGSIRPPPPLQRTIVVVRQNSQEAFWARYLRWRCMIWLALVSVALLGGSTTSSTSRTSSTDRYNSWPVLEGIPVPENNKLVAETFRQHAAGGHRRTITLPECIHMCDVHSPDTKYGIHYQGGAYHDDLCLCFADPTFDCLWDEVAILARKENAHTNSTNESDASITLESSTFYKRLEHGTVFSKYAKPPSCAVNHICNSARELCWNIVGPDSIFSEV